MDGRSDEARTSHTQTLEMGRGPLTGTWARRLRSNCWTPDVGEITMPVYAGVRVCVCACACDVCSLHVVWDAPILLCCFGRLAQ